jgi:hypothetical protein
MADYFLVHDPALLDGQLGPALGRAWRQRSFAPCVPLCRQWAPAAEDYARRYHVNLDETVLAHVEQLPFDRALWRTLVGELLLFTAREVPELPLPAATLSVLLSPGHRPERPDSRAAFAPIHQALYGTRDLLFGPVVYRPDAAGLNRPEDVARLSVYFSAVRPDTWQAADLAGLPDLDESDRADELELAREWFAALADLHVRAAGQGHSIVVEQIF